MAFEFPDETAADVEPKGPLPEKILQALSDLRLSQAIEREKGVAANPPHESPGGRIGNQQ